MRVTNGMLADTMLWNLTRTTDRLNRLQDQLSSGQRIGQPSDDPVGTATVLRLDTTKAQNDQYLTNIQDAKTWLGASDQALAGISDDLQRAREITLQAANGTLSSDERSAIATELNQLLADAVQTANASVAGQYVFAGQKTHTAPFAASATPPTYQGDGGAISRQIDTGVTVAVNVTGDTAILPALQALQQAATTVGANDQAGMLAGINALDAGNTTVLAARARVGALTNRMDAQTTRLDALQVSVAQLRSDTQDVDMAKAMTDYSTQDTVYKAALAAGARAVQPTLFDYMA